jgi:penicillin-binding protein 1A
MQRVAASVARAGRVPRQSSQSCTKSALFLRKALSSRTKKPPRRARSKENRARRRVPWKRWLGLTFLVGTFLAGAIVSFYIWRASSFDLQGVGQMKERSTVFDMDAKVWGRLQGENRVPVKLDEVSPNFVAALLAREDTRFHSHFGVDPKGLLRALVRTAQGQQQGGSTLTQQLARNSYTALGQRKSMDRKLLELFVALRMERVYSKDQILEHYMNRIYFGSGMYGIEMASKNYFGKAAKDLTLGEAAMIAGVIRAPTKASPFTNLKRAIAERDMVLDRLASDDCKDVRERYKISTEMVAVARKQPLKLALRKAVSTQENYAMDMIMRELETLLEDEQQDQGGLKIYTTIDPVLQDEAQKSLDRALTKIEQRPGYAHPRKSEFTEEARKAELQPPYLQGAVVVVDNRSGGLRAIVGGRDYRESKFNRAIEAKRTIGSTFKPFVYAAAFARGLSPWAEISDGPIQRGEIEGAPGWTPGNSDDKFGGYLPVEDGLIRSRNTMTIRVGNVAGLDAVKKLADKVGLTEMPANPQSYIGNFGATPKDVTLAYTALANGGLKRQGYLIERIDDAEGEVIYRASHATYRAIDPGVAQTTTNILVRVFEHGTAASAKSLGWTRPAAGKTGTTDDYHDAWFAGYTASLTCGVWVGLDKPATIVPRGYGATLALPVWVDVMKKAPENKYPASAVRTAGPVARATPPRQPDEDSPGGLRTAPPKAESGGLLRPFRRFFGDR